MNVSEDFLKSANRQFLYYKTLGEKAIDQLDAEQLFVSLNDDTNSIATIVKHLHGKYAFSLDRLLDNRWGKGMAQ